jgi:hypothetical protein
MKTYRILASYTVYFSMDVEAENVDAAREMAQEADGGDFNADENSDWNIDDVIEMESDLEI